MTKVRVRVPWFGPDSISRRPGRGQGANADEYEVPSDWELPPAVEVLDDSSVGDAEVEDDGDDDDVEVEDAEEDEADEEEVDELAAALEAQDNEQAAQKKAQDAENAEAVKQNAKARSARARKRVASK